MNITVIANTPKGLCCTHGDKSTLGKRSDDCSNCTLYLHHMFHPTIPSYHRQTEQRYVLIVPCNDDVSPNVEPFSGIVYPPEYAPYGKRRNNAKKRSPRVKKSNAFCFPRKNVCENALTPTPAQLDAVPQLAFFSLPNAAKLLASTANSLRFSIEIKEANQLRNLEYLNDNHISLLLTG